MFIRPSYLIPVAMAVCCCCQSLTSHGQSAASSGRGPASKQQQSIRPADVHIVGTGISETIPETGELKDWDSSRRPRSASVVEHSLNHSEPNRRPTDVLLVARRETIRDFSIAAAANVPRASEKPTHSFDPQELEQVELFLIDDVPQTGINSEDDDNTTATQGIAATRANFREMLRRPLPSDPVQMALQYVDDDGNPVPDSEFRHSFLTQFAGFNSRPFGDGDCRLDAFNSCWHTKSYVWKSPDLCYGPLYFEEVNLERFGGRFPVMQPAISAVQFVGNTIRLPYSMGLQSPHHCYYSAGYGRPGNQYCYQYERPVWSLKGGTLQALLITGVVFGLP